MVFLSDKNDEVVKVANYKEKVMNSSKDTLAISLLKMVDDGIMMDSDARNNSLNLVKAHYKSLNDVSPKMDLDTYVKEADVDLPENIEDFLPVMSSSSSSDDSSGAGAGIKIDFSKFVEKFFKLVEEYKKGVVTSESCESEDCDCDCHYNRWRYGGKCSDCDEGESFKTMNFTPVVDFVKYVINLCMKLFEKNDYTNAMKLFIHVVGAFMIVDLVEKVSFGNSGETRTGAREKEEKLVKFCSYAISKTMLMHHHMVPGKLKMELFDLCDEWTKLKKVHKVYMDSIKKDLFSKDLIEKVISGAKKVEEIQQQDISESQEIAKFRLTSILKADSNNNEGETIEEKLEKCYRYARLIKLDLVVTCILVIKKEYVKIFDRVKTCIGKIDQSNEKVRVVECLLALLLTTVSETKKERKIIVEYLKKVVENLPTLEDPYSENVRAAHMEQAFDLPPPPPSSIRIPDFRPVVVQEIPLMEMPSLVSPSKQKKKKKAAVVIIDDSDDDEEKEENVEMGEKWDEWKIQEHIRMLGSHFHMGLMMPGVGFGGGGSTGNGNGNNKIPEGMQHNIKLCIEIFNSHVLRVKVMGEELRPIHVLLVGLLEKITFKDFSVNLQKLFISLVFQFTIVFEGDIERVCETVIQKCNAKEITLYVCDLLKKKHRLTNLDILKGVNEKLMFNDLEKYVARDIRGTAFLKEYHNSLGEESFVASLVQFFRSYLPAVPFDLLKHKAFEKFFREKVASRAGNSRTITENIKRFIGDGNTSSHSNLQLLNELFAFGRSFFKVDVCRYFFNIFLFEILLKMVTFPASNRSWSDRNKISQIKAFVQSITYTQLLKIENSPEILSIVVKTIVSKLDSAFYKNDEEISFRLLSMGELLDATTRSSLIVKLKREVEMKIDSRQKMSRVVKTCRALLSYCEKGSEEKLKVWKVLLILTADVEELKKFTFEFATHVKPFAVNLLDISYMKNPKYKMPLDRGEVKSRLNFFFFLHNKYPTEQSFMNIILHMLIIYCKYPDLLCEFLSKYEVKEDWMMTYAGYFAKAITDNAPKGRSYSTSFATTYSLIKELAKRKFPRISKRLLDHFDPLILKDTTYRNVKNSRAWLEFFKEVCELNKTPKLVFAVTVDKYISNVCTTKYAQWRNTFRRFLDNLKNTYKV